MRLRYRAAFALALFLAIPGLLIAQTGLPAPRGIKNVILLIPDGMSVDAVTLARWYNGGAPLALDSMASGLVRTYNADTPIADSAPAATAFATGYKSDTPYIGVLPAKAGMWGVPSIVPDDIKRPVASILEAARLAGKGTGLVVTCELPHATPAAFASHDPSRKAYDDILEQEVYNGVDVVLGGGYQYLSQRADGEDLIGALLDSGYSYVNSPEELAAIRSGKVWGLFAPIALAYDMDRDASVEPSLADMTGKAIDLLSQRKNGFFLMVEGSKIDWAAHANDPVGIVSDVLAFDRAVARAVDFASKRRDTLVIVVSDHGNSGLTIGNAATSSDYYATPLSTFIDPLKRAKLTGEGLEKLFNADRSNARQVMADWFGITDLTDDEVKAIVASKAGSMNYTVGPMIAARARLGFTTTGHTGEETVLYTYSPDPAGRLVGVWQNNDIARYMAKALGLDLDATTKKLYVEATAAFAAKGASVTVDTSVAANPVLVVRKGSTELRIPRNKNYVILDGKQVATDGVNVFISDTGKWYVGRKVIDLLR